MENGLKKNQKTVSRRGFVKGAVLGTAALALKFKKLMAQAEPAGKTVLFSAQNPAGKVVLIRNEAAVNEAHAVNARIAAEMIDSAVKTLSGETDVLKAWGRFIKPGDTVGVKFTRCDWMRVHTEQAVIDAIVKRLGDLGIPKDRIYAEDGGLPFKKCTALINVPTIKIHTLMGIASALKNYINFSDKRSSYHFEGSVKLGEIWHLPDVKGKTRLVIVDALRPYFGPGPQINPLHRWDYKGIMASTDPVACDTVSLKICQAKRTLFKGEEWPINPPPKSIAAADTDYKLGTSDPAKIQLIRLGWEKGILI